MGECLRRQKRSGVMDIKLPDFSDMGFHPSCELRNEYREFRQALNRFVCLWSHEAQVADEGLPRETNFESFYAPENAKIRKTIVENDPIRKCAIWLFKERKRQKETADA